MLSLGQEIAGNSSQESRRWDDVADFGHSYRVTSEGLKSLECGEGDCAATEAELVDTDVAKHLPLDPVLGLMPPCEFDVSSSP